MPFEFSGETPSFGSTSDAPSPFSFGATSANPSPIRTFTAIPPFRSTSSWIQTSSFSNSFSRPQASSRQQHESAYNTVAADSSKSSDLKVDRLSRSLERARLKRTSVFSTDKTADDIIATYLQKMAADGRAEPNHVSKLECVLNKMDETCPEAMKFLHHVFERASTSVAPVTKSSDLKFKLRDEAGEVPDQAPDAYHDIVPGTSLYNACATAITDKLGVNGTGTTYYYHRNTYLELGADVANLVAIGATRAEVRQFFGTGASGRFMPSANIARDVDEMVDQIYERVLHVKKQFRDGSVVKNRDEASYFGHGLEKGKERALKSSTNDILQNGKYRGWCCPYQELPREPPPSQPFRFMDLPPEIRNIIYRKALAPGIVGLVSCPHNEPRGTRPLLVPQLLKTCKQIYTEAKDLLLENTLQVTFTPCWIGSPSQPSLHALQLPPHITTKLKHLVLLVDCVRFNGLNSDPDGLQAFTALETLRIVAIEEEEPIHAISAANLSIILVEIVMRIPARCEVYYGSRPGAEASFARFMAGTLKHKAINYRDRQDEIKEITEVDIGKLKDAAQAVPDSVVQGSKSGQPPSRRRLPGELIGLGLIGGT